MFEDDRDDGVAGKYLGDEDALGCGVIEMAYVAGVPCNGVCGHSSVGNGSD